MPCPTASQIPTCKRFHLPKSAFSRSTERISPKKALYKALFHIPLGFNPRSNVKQAAALTDVGLFWRRKRDLKLLCNPSCGARKNPRASAFPRFFRPLRQPLLAVSAAGGARRRCPRLSALGFNPRSNVKQAAALTDVGLFWRRKRDLNPRAGYPTYSLSRGAPSPLGYFSKR